MFTKNNKTRKQSQMGTSLNWIGITWTVLYEPKRLFLKDKDTTALVTHS